MHNTVLYVLNNIEYPIMFASNILPASGFLCTGPCAGVEGRGRREVTASRQIEGALYKFTSYDPGVTQMYSERFPWIGARNLVVACTNKTAMTLDLALLLKSLIASGKFSRKMQ